MKPSPQDRGQRRQGRPILLSRSDLSGSGRARRRDEVAAEGQKRARSRARPRPPVSEAWQHGAASEKAFTVAPESAQDLSTARCAPNNGGSAATETQTKKPILQQGPVAELPAAVIDQLWQANPLQKLLPIDWGAITQALSTLSARSMADPVHAAAVAANLSLKLWQEAVETWIGAGSRWWGLATPTEDKLRGPAADRRFEAPEWEQHPFFRPQAGLSRHRCPASRGSRPRGCRSDRTAPPHVPRPTVDRRDESDPVSADEPGGSSQGVGDGWRQRG